MEASQIKDVTKGTCNICVCSRKPYFITAIFHTILFHRSTGKFTYQQQGNIFSVGSIGMEDVDCSTVEFTYVRCASHGLELWVDTHSSDFARSLSNVELPASGQLTLEFYERRKGRWLIFADNSSWEMWKLKLNVVRIKTDAGKLQIFQFCKLFHQTEWQQHQKKLAKELAENIQYICWAVNKPDYLPKNPVEEDLTNVFDTQFTEVQPYLHHFNHELTSETMGNTVRKLIRNTFAY